MTRRTSSTNLLSRCFSSAVHSVSLRFISARPADRRLPAGHQPRDEPRPAVVRRPAHPARRHHPRRDRAGAGQLRQPGARQARRGSPCYPGRRRRDRDDRRVQRADGEGAGEGGEGEGGPADLLQAGRDAGVHAGRVQRGGCHGAARGKDGFRLSLFGFDPDGDHYRLTRELNGRRINLALPAESRCCSKGAAARCRTPAGKRIKRGRRVLPGDHPLARGRRPARPADRRHCR